MKYYSFIYSQVSNQNRISFNNNDIDNNNSGNSTHAQHDGRIKSQSNDIKKSELDLEAQKMVNEIEGIKTRDELRKYLSDRFPSLLRDSKEAEMISVEKVDNLQNQLKHIINLNQQLTQDIAISYKQYDVLKADNDKNIPLLCNAISKIENNIETLENELEERKLERTKYSELFKKENQSELVLSVEYAREGY